MYNLTFKEFLRQVVVPCTPEDEKDSLYFEFDGWIKSNFFGIPSIEVQRLVDSNIPVWLNDFDDVEEFVKKLCKIQLKELGIRSAVIAVRYSVEKCWKNKQDIRPIQAVELVEKWLENENSVMGEELRKATNAAYEAAVYTSGVSCSAATSAYTVTRAAYAVTRAAYAEQVIWAIEIAVKNAALATSNKEICQVIIEKLPKFCYEDLLRVNYLTKEKENV